MKRAILFGLTTPAAIVPLMLWAALGLFAGKNWRRDGVILKWTMRRWAEKIWPYTTRVLYVEVSHPRHVDIASVKVHEDTHTRQMQDYAFLFFVVALLAWAGGCNPWVAGALGVFGPWLIMLNYVTAWLRGWHPYRGAGHEIDARANAYEVTRGATVRDKDSKFPKNPKEPF